MKNSSKMASIPCGRYNGHCCTMLFNVKSFSVLFLIDELGIMIRGTMDGDSAKHRKVKKTKTGLLSNDLYRRLGDSPET